MNHASARIRLHQVMKPVSRPETVAPTRQYNILGAHWYARGLYIKETKQGSEIQASTVYRVEHGDFVYNRLFAWKGSFALASELDHGCYVSNEFPCFEVDRSQVDPKYLSYYFSQESSWNRALALSSGGTPTSRNRLKEEKFLAMEIPRVSLADQQRTVARIDDLAVRIQEAQTLREEAAKEIDALLLARVGEVLSLLETDYPMRSLGSFAPHVTSGPRNWAKHYDKGGLRFYRAQDVGPYGQILNDSKVFVQPPPGAQGRTSLLQEGDLMLVITGATVGRVSVFRKALEPGLVSQHVAICRLPQSEVYPDYVLWGLRGPVGQSQLLGKKYGQGKPGLNLANIRSLSLPFPPVAEQQRIVADLDVIQTEVDRVKSLQAETATELEALLPAILSKAFREGSSNVVG
jgi:type I restriction enzyme S subunit